MSDDKKIIIVGEGDSGATAAMMIAETLAKSMDGKEIILVEGKRHSDEKFNQFIETMSRPRQRIPELASVMASKYPKGEKGYNQTFPKPAAKPGRNEKCHCGSGKKHKHCHGG